MGNFMSKSINQSINQPIIITRNVQLLSYYIHSTHDVMMEMTRQGRMI